MNDVEDTRLAELSAELAWLRRLARALLRTDEAADLAQDAWLVAASEAPLDRPLRPWLSRVALNLARMRRRSRLRRETREQAIAALAEPITTPDELVQKLEVQHLVAGEVLRLAEPYRSTVLLHYFEELSCAEIARRLEIPEGTVRRRLKVALDELRARLDRGDGKLAALVPLAGLPAVSTPAAVAVGVIVMKKILIAAVVVLALLAALWWNHERAGGEKVSVAKKPPSPVELTARAAARAAQQDPPAWMGQHGAKPRHVAGRVLLHGVPFPNATVELASIASESGLVPAPRIATNSDGEFDFGEQAAMELSVRASAPGKSGAALDIDLRNPQLAADHLVLLLGDCSAMLMGTVRDASGGTIAQARITRLPVDAPSPIPGGTSVTTDEKGHYEICVEARWPGWVAVQVSAQGYGSITFMSMVPGRMNVDFALLPEATIVGHVIRDDTRAPVARAYVYVPQGPRGNQTTAWRGTFTDSAGRFKIDGVAPGPHNLFARAEGMAESRGTPLTLEAGQVSTDIEIRLETESRIRGTVVDHDHKPVVGARVATAPVDGRTVTPVVSQEDGSFELTEVPRGTLRFTAAPYEVVTPQTFAVTQALHDNVTIEVSSLGTVIGHVVRDKAPMPDATISMEGPNARDLGPVHADETGRFEVKGLRAGKWTFYASNDHEGSFGGPNTVHVGNGETAEVTIDITYSAAISGRVIDQNGDPVSGVTVGFQNTKTIDGGQGVTAVDGTFRAPSLTGGGDYRPTVMSNLLSTAKLRPAAGDTFPLVTVADGRSEVTDVVLAVQLDHMTIAGKVVNQDGAAMPDVRVVAELTQPGTQAMFFRGRQDPAATTDMDGHFSITDLPDGTYTMQARTTTNDTVTVADIKAGRSDVTLTVPTAGSIDGTWAGFKSAPEITAFNNNEAVAVAAVVDGTAFSIHNLSPGSYVVTARTATEAASATVDVASGRASHTTLTSPGTGAITGHVHDFRTGAPVEGMTCGAATRVGITPGKSGADTAHSDASGAFSIDAAPAGDIVVYCYGLPRVYSDGARLITLQQTADVDMPVVAWSDDQVSASLDARFDYRVLVPRLFQLRAGGAAANAGLQEGDVIVSVDGTAVTNLSINGVHILIINRPPGSKVRLGVSRGGKLITADMTLGEY